MTSVRLRMRCAAFNTTNQGAVAKLLQKGFQRRLVTSGARHYMLLVHCLAVSCGKQQFPHPGLPGCCEVIDTAP